MLREIAPNGKPPSVTDAATSLSRGCLSRDARHNRRGDGCEGPRIGAVEKRQPSCSSPITRSRKDTAMKKLGLVTLVLAIVLVWAGETVFAQTQADSETEIKALLDQLSDGLRRKDLDAIMKVYATDDSLVVFDVVPPRQYVGPAAYRKSYENFLANFQGPVKFEITDLNIVARRGLAYSRCIQQVSGTDTKGKPLNLTWRATDVYRRIGGKWLIAHEHLSVPVDVLTGKADLQSKP
jgi:uncharacterized protein (TIGR02246 family)